MIYCVETLGKIHVNHPFPLILANKHRSFGYGHGDNYVQAGNHSLTGGIQDQILAEEYSAEPAVLPGHGLQESQTIASSITLRD
jgi:hypothetical protein